MGVKKTAAEKAKAKAERKKKLAAKKAARLAKKAGVAPPPPPSGGAADGGNAGGGTNAHTAGLAELPSLDHVHITGVLSSRPDSVDVSPVHNRTSLAGHPPLDPPRHFVITIMCHVRR